MTEMMAVTVLAARVVEALRGAARLLGRGWRD